MGWEIIIENVAKDGRYLKVKWRSLWSLARWLRWLYFCQGESEAPWSKARQKLTNLFLYWTRFRVK
jgi:hypothetical protein